MQNSMRNKRFCNAAAVPSHRQRQEHWHQISQCQHRHQPAVIRSLQAGLPGVLRTRSEFELLSTMAITGCTRTLLV
jgi:hypothetical protein